jgi:hypothetical protein
MVGAIESGIIAALVESHHSANLSHRWRNWFGAASRRDGPHRHWPRVRLLALLGLSHFYLAYSLSKSRGELFTTRGMTKVNHLEPRLR